MSSSASRLIPDDDVTGIVGRRVVRNYLLTVGRLVIGQALAAVVFLVMSNRLSEPEYAVFSGFAIGVQSVYFLMAAPLTTVLARQQSNLERRVVDASATLLAVVVVFMGVAFYALATAATDWPAMLPLAAGLYAAALAVSFPSYTLLYRNVRTGAQALLDLLDRLTFQVVTLGGILAGWSIERALTAGLVATGAVFLATAQWLYPYRVRPADPRHAKAVARPALHPFVALLGVTLAEALTIPLVALLASPTQAGLYGWAFAIATMPLGFVMSAAIGMQPAFSRIEPEAVRDVAARSVRIVSSLAVGLCVLGAVVVPPLAGVVVPERWLAAEETLLVLLAGVVVHGCGAVLIALWNARHSLRSVSRWQLQAYLSGFAASIPLAFALGSLGAALAYLLARVILASRLLVAGQRELRLPLIATAAGYVATACAAAAGGIAMRGVTSDPWLEVCAGAAVAITLCLAGLVLVTRGAIVGDLRLVGTLLVQRLPAVSAPGKDGA